MGPSSSPLVRCTIMYVQYCAYEGLLSTQPVMRVLQREDEGPRNPSRDAPHASMRCPYIQKGTRKSYVIRSPAHLAALDSDLDQENKKTDGCHAMARPTHGQSCVLRCLPRPVTHPMPTSMDSRSAFCHLSHGGPAFCERPTWDEERGAAPFSPEAFPVRSGCNR